MARVPLVDIHCHILPGIDDGPDELATSVVMARTASEAGISTLVATPHLRPDFPQVKVDEIADRCAELRAALDQEGIELEIQAGGEIGLIWALEADEAQLKLASYGQRGRNLLIETPNAGGAIFSRQLAGITGRGYRLILAHPERLGDFQSDPRLLRDLVERGVMLQVNADAVLGNARKSASAKLAQSLVVSGMAAVVAGDAHRAAKWRPVTRLAEAQAALTKLAGADVAAHTSVRPPRRILSGEALEPVRLRPSGGLLHRFRR